LLADDFEIVRRSLRVLLESQQGWKVCAEAETGQEAIEKTKSLKPDVVILDVSMPVLNGFGAAKAIKELSPETTILVYSIHATEAFKNEAQRIGVDAYVSKADGGRAILRIIEALQRNDLSNRPN
jgi:DNA-binding NarL/FixJ family response regulator